MNQEVWDTLPPLQGANLGLVASNNAHVLVNFQNDKGNFFPILVAGSFGKGRTALLGTDSIWNWSFRNTGGGGRYYQRFWNNVIDWMIAEPQTRRLQLESDKERYREEEQVLIKFLSLIHI